MTWIDATVADFCRGMGLDPPGFGDAGALRLSFERSGTLTLERHDETILVMLARPAPRPAAADVLVRALDLCHPRHGRPVACAAGLYRDDLVFLTRFAATDFTPPALQRAFEELIHLHDVVTA